MEPNTIVLTRANHSFLHIKADPGVLHEIQDYFSFFVKNYQYMQKFKEGLWDGKIRLFNLRTRMLPIGLLNSLEEMLRSRGYETQHVDNPYFGPVQAEDNSVSEDSFLLYPITSRGEEIEPHDYQLFALVEAIRTSCGLFLSPTASGKSLIIYLAIRVFLDNYDTDVLLVVPNKSLVKQMHGDFKDYSEFDDSFDAEKEVHWLMAGRDKISDKRILLTTWQSVYKQEEEFFERFGMCIVDEAHLAKAKSLSAIMANAKNAKFRLGFTGTLDGEESSEMQLVGHFGPVKQVTTTKKMMDDGKASNLKIQVVNLKYPPEDIDLAKKMTYQQEIDFLVSHEKRMDFVVNVALQQTGNTLVLFRYVQKHGKEIYKRLLDKASQGRKVFFVAGEVDVQIRDDIRAIVEKEKNAIIVASFATMSTGSNIRNIHNLIFPAPSKSQINVLQSIGRGLRLSDNGQDTLLIDIVDDLRAGKKENYAFKHGVERIKIYNNQNFNYKIYTIPL